MAYKLKQLFFSPSITFVVLISLVDTSQSQQVDFIKTYAVSGFSSYCYDMTITHDNKYLLTGTDWYFNSDKNSFLLKTDSAGNIIWSRIDTISNVDNEASFVKEMSNGDYIIGGTIYGLVYSSFVLRYDSTGLLKWKKIFEIPGMFIELKTVVEVNNNLFFIGFKDAGLGNVAFLLKTNINGDTLNYWPSIPFHPGSNSISALNYGSDKIIISGGEYDTISMSYTPQVTVIDTTCNIFWQQSYPVGSSLIAQQIYQIPGGYIFTSSGSGTDHISRIDSIGNTIWNQPLSSPFPNALCFVDLNTIMISRASISLLWLNGSGNGISNETISMPHGGEVSRAFHVNRKIVIAGSMFTSSSPVRGVAYLIQFSDTNVTTSSELPIVYPQIFFHPSICNNCHELYLHTGYNLSQILISDISGKEVSIKVKPKQGPNYYIIPIPENLSSGYYVIKIQSDEVNCSLKFYYERE